MHLKTYLCEGWGSRGGIYRDWQVPNGKLLDLSLNPYPTLGLISWLKNLKTAPWCFFTSLHTIMKILCLGWGWGSVREWTNKWKPNFAGDYIILSNILSWDFWTVTLDSFDVLRNRVHLKTYLGEGWGSGGGIYIEIDIYQMASCWTCHSTLTRHRVVQTWTSIGKSLDHS